MLTSSTEYKPKFKPGDLVKSMEFNIRRVIVGITYIDLGSPGFENTLCYVYFQNGQKLWIACDVLDGLTEKCGQ